MKRTFKTMSGAVIAALAVAASGTAFADASSAPAVIVLPPTVVVEPTQVVGPMTPTPESPAIARKEAAAALAEAKRDCRRQPDSEQKSCLSAAQDDYRSQMANARSVDR